jgi:hypothetical protein
VLAALAGEPCQGPGVDGETGALALVGDGSAWLTAAEGAGATVSVVEPATVCPSFGAVTKQGRIRDGAAVELSGLVESPTQGVLWTHNDGDGDLLMAVTPDGELAAAYWLEGSPGQDWEDLALGAGPEPGRDYLYAADTGDNALSRKNVQLIRLPEPVVDASGPSVEPLGDYEVFTLAYPGKAEHDGEALVVDPLDGAVYLFTKSNKSDQRTRVYRAPALDASGEVALELVLTERDSPFLSGTMVAADITAAGDWLVLAVKEDEVRLWQRRAARPLWEVLQTPPCLGPIAPGQVESVALSVARDGYWMVPEGEDPRLTFVAFEWRDGGARGAAAPAPAAKPGYWPL